MKQYNFKLLSGMPKEAFAGHREIFVMNMWWQKKDREKLLDASKKKTKLSL
jgi:hypothetical protein